jgi:GT2 family glycosyltransferase
MPLSDLTVVMVTFNSEHCMEELAPVLKRLPNLVIVDNASNDKTVKFIEQKIPNAKIIANGKNIGFGAANNQAIRDATTPYLFLLNPDCEITIEILQEFIKQAEIFPDAAILAPQLIRSNGEKDVSYRLPRSYWASQGGAADGPCCVGFASGAALFLNLKNSKNLFFDESYFLYYEDDDLCQRIFEEKTQVILIPEIRLTHRLGGSVRYKKPFIAHYYGGFYLTQSHILYSYKYAGKDKAKKLQRKYMYASLLKAVVFALILNPKKSMRFLGRAAAALQSYNLPGTSG